MQRKRGWEYHWWSQKSETQVHFISWASGSNEGIKSWFKLLEAVRNNKMDFNLTEDEIDDESYNNYEYEDYYDEYCDNEI